MYQAIKTRYSGPTNTREARIIASCDAGRISVPYAHDLDSEGNHLNAARSLCAKLGWDGELASGVINNEYIHVFTRLGNVRHAPVSTNRP